MRPRGALMVPTTGRPSSRAAADYRGLLGEVANGLGFRMAARRFLRRSQPPASGPETPFSAAASDLLCCPGAMEEGRVAASDNGGLLSEVASRTGCSGRSAREFLGGSQLPSVRHRYRMRPRRPGGDEPFRTHGRRFGSRWALIGSCEWDGRSGGPARRFHGVSQLPVVLPGPPLSDAASGARVTTNLLGAWSWPLRITVGSYRKLRVGRALGTACAAVSRRVATSTDHRYRMRLR